MGLKDHLEDGTGHILNLELDYLHVDGTQRQAGAPHVGVQEEVGVGAHSTDTSLPTSNSSSSSCSNVFEEISDSDDERAHSVSTASQKLTESMETNGDPLKLKPSPDTDCRSKVDFALKLGYSEELVLLVLRKLGPDALINDVLGELVKLGTKPDLQPQGGGSSVTASLTSTTSVDSCSLHSSQWAEDKENLRPVVVDGSNVAMSHGNKEVFSCQGIQLAVDWFLERGHRDITVFVPAWRKEQSRPDALISDQEILGRLEKQKILVFTPSRRVQGRRVVCYDDRFIVKLAYESDGIIVSNDNYRDLANEKPEWKKFIDERLLMYSFVNDKFMPPDDPLGRHGPSLENFLRKRHLVPENRRQPCPYGKKCTYGHKCKFYHPERGSQPQRAVADELRASAKISSAARSLLEDALTGEVEGADEPEHWQSTPKKQSSPSLRGSLSDLFEDRICGQRKIESRRGSSSSSSSGCSSFLGYVPGGPPSAGSLDRWDSMGSGSSSGAFKGISKAFGASECQTHSRCESPEVSYSSLVKAYSGLSLLVPESPERFPSAPDLKAGSLLSDCSSDGSSNIFSPDPILDDGPKCHHSDGRYSCHSMYSESRSGRKLHSPQAYSPALPKQHSLETNFSFEESTSSHNSNLGHNQHSLQGSPQVLLKHGFEQSNSFTSHRSLLSIADCPQSFPQGYPTGLRKQHSFLVGNCFEDTSSSMNSHLSLRSHVKSCGSNQQSPSSKCQDFTKRHGFETNFSIEESTSSLASSISFNSCSGLNQHSPQACPPGLSKQHGFGHEGSPSLLPCHASLISHMNRPEVNKQSPPGLPKPHDFESDYSFENPPSSVASHISQGPFITSTNAYMSPKGFSGDFYNLPPRTPHVSTARSHQLKSHVGYNMMGSPWQKGGVQDPRIYESTLPNSTRSNSTEPPQIKWDIHYQQSYKSHDSFAKNLQETNDRTLNSPWGRLLSPHGPIKQSTTIPSHQSHSPLGLYLQQEPPALSQYQDLRERLFINLCGIFPPDLVRLVMARNPQVMDAQELAAAILLANSQRGT